MFLAYELKGLRMDFNNQSIRKSGLMRKANITYLYKQVHNIVDNLIWTNSKRNTSCRHELRDVLLKQGLWDYRFR